MSTFSPGGELLDDQRVGAGLVDHEGIAAVARAAVGVEVGTEADDPAHRLGHVEGGGARPHGATRQVDRRRPGAERGLYVARLAEAVAVEGAAAPAREITLLERRRPCTGRPSERGRAREQHLRRRRDVLAHGAPRDLGPGEGDGAGVARSLDVAGVEGPRLHVDGRHAGSATLEVAVHEEDHRVCARAGRGRHLDGRDRVVARQVADRQDVVLIADAGHGLTFEHQVLEASCCTRPGPCEC